MGLFQRVGKLFGLSWGGPGVTSWPQVRSWSWTVFGDGDGSSRVTQPYAQHAAVRTGVSAIARDASCIQWEAFRKKGKGKDKPVDHPVSEILASPNPYLHGNQLMVGTIVSYVLHGEAFWYYPGVRVMERGLYGMDRLKPVIGELQLLNPACVINEPNEAGTDMRWFIQRNGERVPISPDEFTHFKDYNPYNEYRGLSRLAAAMLEVESDHAAARWSLGYFRNGATPSGVLIPAIGALMTKDQRDDMLRVFTERHGGDKRGVGILPAGWDFKDFGVNHHDMDFPMLRNWSREQILAVLGVPPFMAGVLENANYANAREQERLYWRHTIKPMVDTLQASINLDFLPKVGVSNYELWPKWEAVASLLEDHESKSTIAQRYWSMGVPFEQINERLELGFDPQRVPMADAGFLPLNVAPTTTLADLMDAELDAKENPPQPMLPPAPTEGSEGEDDADLPPGQRALMRKNDMVREQRRTVIWRNIMLRTTDLELNFARRWRGLVKGWQKEALDNLEGLKGWSLRNEKADTPARYYLFDLDKAKRKARQVTKPVYEETMARGGEQVLAELGLSGSFSVTSPAAISIMADNYRRLQGAIEAFADDLAAALKEGVGQGETFDQLRDRLNAKFNVGQSKARVYARTEVSSAYNSARVAEYGEVGVEKHEWLTSRDSAVRDTHATLDGEVRNVGDSFSNGLLHPLDPNGPASEVVNCRCTTVAVLENENV